MGSGIGDVLKSQAKSLPQNQALAFPEQDLYFTYQQWWDESCRIAGALIAMGVEPGDRVALQAQNRMEWAVIQMAVMLCGGIFVPLNTHFGAEETHYVLDHSGTRVLFLSNQFRSHDYLENVNTIRSTLPVLECVVTLDEGSEHSLFYPELGQESTRFPQVTGSDNAALLYTSGTTGFPKGALLSHESMLFVPYQCKERLKLTELDRWTSIIPLFHCAGCIMNLMGSMVAGGSYVGVSAFDPVLMFKVIEAEKCTALSGVPTSFLAMLEHPERKNYDLSSLRTGTCGGALVDPQMLERCAREYPIPELCNVYGLTETATISALPFCDDPQRFTTSGGALDKSKLRITDPERGKSVPSGHIGQIEVQGPMIMNGYYQNPTETELTIDKQGWLKTGDLGYLTDSGKLCVSAGRLKEMIIRGGENIYPLEVETVLMGHKNVDLVAVFGMADDYYGEIPAAAVVANQQIDFDELERLGRKHLAGYKVPSVWFEVEKLPMTASGKVKKLELKAMVERGELVA